MNSSIISIVFDISVDEATTLLTALVTARAAPSRGERGVQYSAVYCSGASGAIRDRTRHQASFRDRSS